MANKEKLAVRNVQNVIAYIEEPWRAALSDAAGKLLLAELDYDAAMWEIGEIVRVARDNPKDLQMFLKLNFPEQWGLSKKEHRKLFKQECEKA